MVLDRPATTLVDHTVMDKLHEIEKEFREAGRSWSSLASNGTSRCRRIRPRRGTPCGGRWPAPPAPAGHERYAGYPNDTRHAPPAPDVERVRRLVEAACEPVAQLWPLKRFTYHGPIFGLENLPFDQAVREGGRLIGGKGYLANAEYRRFAADGRITSDAVTTALRRRPARRRTHAGRRRGPPHRSRRGLAGAVALRIRTARAAVARLDGRPQRVVVANRTRPPRRVPPTAPIVSP